MVFGFIMPRSGPTSDQQMTHAQTMRGLAGRYHVASDTADSDERDSLIARMLVEIKTFQMTRPPFEPLDAAAAKGIAKAWLDAARG